MAGSESGGVHWRQAAGPARATFAVVSTAESGAGPRQPGAHDHQIGAGAGPFVGPTSCRCGQVRRRFRHRRGRFRRRLPPRAEPQAGRPASTSSGGIGAHRRQQNACRFRGDGADDGFRVIGGQGVDAGVSGEAQGAMGLHMGRRSGSTGFAWGRPATWWKARRVSSANRPAWAGSWAQDGAIGEGGGAQPFLPVAPRRTGLAPLARRRPVVPAAAAGGPRKSMSGARAVATGVCGFSTPAAAVSEAAVRACGMGGTCGDGPMRDPITARVRPQCRRPQAPRRRPAPPPLAPRVRWRPWVRATNEQIYSHLFARLGRLEAVQIPSMT